MADIPRPSLPLTSTWVVPAFPRPPRASSQTWYLQTFRNTLTIRRFRASSPLTEYSFEEYLPKVDGANGQELYDDGPLYHRLHATQYGGASLSQVPCTLAVPKKSPLESLDLTFAVRCKGPTRFALPVTYNRYSSVFFRDPQGRLRQIPYSHVSTDPRIVINVPSSKPQVVVVHLPTLWGILW